MSTTRIARSGSPSSARPPARLGLDPAPGGRAMIGCVRTDRRTGMLTIGEFARQAGLTPKALRIYDEIGLLRPAEVDPFSGRRRYGAGQVQLARLIGMLRGADLSLAEIGFP